MSNATLRIAIVGSGPAGLYAAAHLLERRSPAVEIDIFERLPTPWGLIRAGVAPDHPEKKHIVDRLFNFHLTDSRVRLFANIEIGTEIMPSDLAQWYHAVIFAVGANDDAKLGIPGESLSGSWAARDFVSFYNGHPDFADLNFDLTSHRAVIIGNGNVALDVARILTLSPNQLERTDIADHALDALKSSAIEEVIILGRRGPHHAAFGNAELEELGLLKDVDVCLAGSATGDRDSDREGPLRWAARRKMETLGSLTSRPRTGRRRIVLQFFASPAAFHGHGRLEAVEVVRTSTDGRPADQGGPVPASCRIDTRLVFRACGYRGSPVAGLPFDQARGVISNVEGRIRDQEGAITGAYVAGWIKRGCRGVIGSNKRCADETVRSLIQDFVQGRLGGQKPDRDTTRRLIENCTRAPVSLEGWLNINHAEQMAGRRSGRPRVKICNRVALLNQAGSMSADSLV
jgi:ferredoxin--NADP+ reductase